MLSHPIIDYIWGILSAHPPNNYNKKTHTDLLDVLVIFLQTESPKHSHILKLLTRAMTETFAWKPTSTIGLQCSLKWRADKQQRSPQTAVGPQSCSWTLESSVTYPSSYWARACYRDVLTVDANRLLSPPPKG